MEHQGQSLHTDLALQYYQKTNWFESVIHSQKSAKQQGLSEWKRLCVETAPWIEPKFKQVLEKIAPTVAFQLTGIQVIKELGAPCFSELKLV